MKQEDKATLAWMCVHHAAADLRDLDYRSQGLQVHLRSAIDCGGYGDAVERVLWTTINKLEEASEALRTAATITGTLAEKLVGDSGQSTGL